MPLQSVWMIRLSLFYLFCAVLFGGFLLIHKAMPLHPGMWGLLPVHYEIAIWGWLVQFVMGTAYWIFPRYLEDKGRGSPVLAWSVVAAINLGLWLLLVSHVLNENLALAGRGLILIATFIFAMIMWNRVVSYRNQR